MTAVDCVVKTIEQAKVPLHVQEILQKCELSGFTDSGLKGGIIKAHAQGFIERVDKGVYTIAQTRQRANMMKEVGFRLKRNESSREFFEDSDKVGERIKRNLGKLLEDIKEADSEMKDQGLIMEGQMILGESEPVSLPRKISIEVSDLCQEASAEFALMEPFGADRDISYARLAQRYRSINHLATEFVWVRFRVKQTDRKIVELRGNGKHTSILFHLFPELIKDYMVVAMVTYDLTSLPYSDAMKTAKLLYERYDDADSVRNVGDLVRQACHDDSTLDDIGHSVVMKAITGMAYNRWGKGYGKARSPNERTGLVHGKGADFVAFFAKLRKKFSGDQRLVSKAPVTAAIEEMWKKDPDLTLNFFEQVRTLKDSEGNNLGQDDPALQLNKFLDRSRIATKSRGPFHRTHEEFFGYCLLCWNMWRNGDKGKVSLPRARGTTEAV